MRFIQLIYNFAWKHNWIPYRIISFLRKQIERQEIKREINKNL